MYNEHKTSDIMTYSHFTSATASEWRSGKYLAEDTHKACPVLKCVNIDMQIQIYFVVPSVVPDYILNGKL